MSEMQTGAATLVTGTDFVTVATEDIDRAVEFKADILDSGVCHQAFFEDPDGNVIGIHHRYAPPDAKPPSA